MGAKADYDTRWDAAASTRRWVDTNLLGKNGPPASNYAADTFAQLTRDQWQSYVQNFVPFEDKLIQYATDPSVVSGAMAEASRDVNTAFDNRQLATTRRLGSMGLSLNADEQAASTRSFGLARSLADVQGQNSARDTTRARQQSILGSPMPRIGLSAGGMG